MNNMTKVIRLQLLYFICLLIVLRGHSFKVFKNDKTGDVFVSEDESAAFDRAMNQDVTGDVSISEVEADAFGLAMNNDETGDAFVSEVEAEALDLSVNSCASTFETEEAIAACEAVSE